MSKTRLIIVSITIAVLVMFFSYHLYFSQEARCLKAEMSSLQYDKMLPDNDVNKVFGYVDNNNKITKKGKAEAQRLCNLKSK